MTINQLFLIKPPMDLLLKLLKHCSINSLDSNVQISLKSLDLNNTLIKSKLILDDISEYYLPCKKKKCFNELDNKKLITIIKQLLKLYDHKLQSNEKYSRGSKYTVYQIIPIKDDVDANLKKTKKSNHVIAKKKVVLKFD